MSRGQRWLAARGEGVGEEGRAVASEIGEADFQARLAFEGTIGLAGLEGRVEIVRDSLGIPHIRAGSAHDAFFAQGFAHAQDRLWQLEFDRRRAAGRWAEYAGSGAVEQDTLMRRLGLVASAQADFAALSAPTRAMLDAYAAGVNAWIETTPSLPIELRLVESAPAPWQPWESCAVFKVRHVLMAPWGIKLWRLRVLRALGPEWLVRLRAGNGTPDPLIVLPGEVYAGVPDGAGESRLTAEALAGVGELASGSNNWVLHGSRTASGSPLLAGDPHRPIDVPNVYYQNHLSCPDFDVIGYSFGGVPGFPHFGHNQRVAWGITHARADYQDLFIERFAPNDPTRYEFRGGWRTAERRRETIAVRGAEPVEIDVTATHHGPIVVGDPAGGVALAMRYTATAEPNASFEALLPMLRARSVDELDEAMRPWVDPGNNMVMADVDGTIGYLMRARIPIRPRANGWLPVPGWTGQHEWQGNIPFDELPRVRNPDLGFIATANNRIVDDAYPHYVSLDWSPPHRAQRLVERLRPLREATVADMAAVHADKLSLPSRVFVDLLRDVEPLDSASAEVKAALLTWDGTMAPGDSAPAIYAVWREQLTVLILEGAAMRPLAETPFGLDPLPQQAVSLASRLRAPLTALLEARHTAVLPPGETWTTLGATALARATAWLAERLGPEMAGWRWDQIHRTAPKHPLSGVFPELAHLLNPPTVGVGGDSDTPQNAGFNGPGSGDFTVAATSVTRYCFDLADWDQSGWTVPLGASGHPGSPHYADQITAWSEQRLSPMLYSWPRIEADAESRQRLEPSAGRWSS